MSRTGEERGRGRLGEGVPGGRGGAGDGSPSERRNSDSLGPWLSANQEKAPPGPGRGGKKEEEGTASVSTHFHTWTNSETCQGKQPTHLCPSLLPFLLLIITQSKKTQHRLSTIGCLLTFSRSALRELPSVTH